MIPDAAAVKQDAAASNDIPLDGPADSAADAVAGSVEAASGASQHDQAGAAGAEAKTMPVAAASDETAPAAMPTLAAVPAPVPATPLSSGIKTVEDGSTVQFSKTFWFYLDNTGQAHGPPVTARNEALCARNVANWRRMSVDVEQSATAASEGAAELPLLVGEERVRRHNYIRP